MVASALAPAAPNARMARILRGWRRAHQPRMRGDRAGDRGAVLMRLLRLAERVERADDHARKLGMAEVDAGIDHRDQDRVAVGERVRLADAELGERVLRRIAAGRDRRRGRDRGRRLQGFGRIGALWPCAGR